MHAFTHTHTKIHKAFFPINKDPRPFNMYINEHLSSVTLLLLLNFGSLYVYKVSVALAVL
jgi:hypothetical protein